MVFIGIFVYICKYTCMKRLGKQTASSHSHLM